MATQYQESSLLTKILYFTLDISLHQPGLISDILNLNSVSSLDFDELKSKSINSTVGGVLSI
jgi:hypothetical protein